jgi:hypothetical protein
MTKEFDNTNRGSIWPRKVRDDDDSAKKYPDFTGGLNVLCPHCGNATDYFFDAWKRKPGASTNAPSLSFKVNPKKQQKDGQPAPRQPDRGAGPSQKSIKEDLEDEIPF